MTQKLATLVITVLAIILPASGFILPGSPSWQLEEQWGLPWLFAQRGPLPSPAEVVIIATNQDVAEALDPLGEQRLTDDLRTWPRQYHAQLVQALQREQAAVMVFDVLFRQHRPSIAAQLQAEDEQFAHAIKQAGNVLLFAKLQRQSRQTVGSTGGVSWDESTLIYPDERLAIAAAMVAPFGVPDTSMANYYWSFQGFADSWRPTLATAALQFYVFSRYPEAYHFLQVWLHQHAPHIAKTLPKLIGSDNASAVTEQLRLPLYNTQLGESLLATLATTASDAPALQALQRYIQVLADQPARYLDFYGGPHSVTTVSYHSVLNGQPRNVVTGEPVTLKDKVVFVGHSEIIPSNASRTEQKDAIHTAVTRADGVKLHGVEVIATAFANMLDKRMVTLTPLWLMALIIVLYAVVMTLILQTGQLQWALLIGLIIIAGWIATARWLFIAHSIWLPLTTPLFIQTTLILIASLFWRYQHSNRERQQIRKQFRLYLPAEKIDALPADPADPAIHGESLFGICMATDAEGYTTLSEHVQPEDLRQLINRYYQKLFSPVRKHRGLVCDVIGDAMLAVWSADEKVTPPRESACLAALDIIASLDDFIWGEHPNTHLPTRIGLNSGPFALGTVGAADHYEYRAVGDIVNTATRIEGMNKYLGTRILASAQTVKGLPGFVIRDMGCFLLKGRTQPTTLYEVMACGEPSTAQHDLCTRFAAARSVFQVGDWSLAREKFAALLDLYPDDGPSRYYLSLSLRYQQSPPPDWQGVILMQQK